MPGPLNLSVIWPDKRTVQVEIEFRQGLSRFRYFKSAETAEPEEEPQEDLVGLNPSDYKDHAAILSYLREATRAIPGGGTLRVGCWDTFEGKVYRALQITANDPQPVRIELGDDG